MTERKRTDVRRTGADPLLMLIERVSAAQVEQGRAQVKQTEELHSIRLQLTEQGSDLKPLVALVGQIRELQITSARHTDQLAGHASHLTGLDSRVASLAATSDRRGGWEGPLGKLGLVLAGCLLTVLLGLALNHARAAEAPVRIPAPSDTPTAIDQPRKPCWAVPAGPAARYLKV